MMIQKIRAEHETGSDSLDAILERIRPLVAASRSTSEEARTLDPALVDALYAEGLFHLWVPRAFGGRDLDPIPTLEFLEKVAEMDASTAWTLMIGIEMGGLVGNYAPDRIADQFFAPEGRAIAGGVVMPGGSLERFGDEYRVTGRWPFGSGSMHCSWMLGSCILIEDGMPVMGENGNPALYVAMMPRKIVQIQDTWSTLGMNGTGSHHWNVREARIPTDHVWAIDAPALRRNAVMDFPWAVLFAATKAVVALGIARAAIEEFRLWASSTQPFGSNYFVSEDTGVQMEYARKVAAHRGARAFLLESVRELWTAGESGKPLGDEDYAIGHLAAVRAGQEAMEIVSGLFHLSGATASIYDGKPMQKLLRDIATVRSHIALSNKLYEASGAALLGGDPVAIMPFWTLNHKTEGVRSGVDR